MALGACSAECDPEACDDRLVVELSSEGFTFGTLELTALQDGALTRCSLFLSPQEPRASCGGIRLSVRESLECPVGDDGFMRCAGSGQFVEEITLLGNASLVELEQTFPGGESFAWSFGPNYEDEAPNDCSDACRVAREFRNLDASE